MKKAEQPRRADESGVMDPFPHMHPLLKKNYGQWDWHDRPRPGVLHHVARSGDEVWTVRAGTQRQMDVHTIRKLCDIADEFADRHLRFTTRSNVEFMVTSEDKTGPLIERLNGAGFPVGGTGNSISMISHTQGWLHCDIPGTDASGVVKALMDELHHEFTHEEMPNRVRITTSCCQINCGGQGDIAINVQYTKPPKINHDLIANVCERPAVVARCPVAAIRPAMVNAHAIHHVPRCRSTGRIQPSWQSGWAASIPMRAPNRPFTSWWPRACRTTHRVGPKWRRS
jgi:sulfite reductase beta subunit